MKKAASTTNSEPFRSSYELLNLIMSRIWFGDNLMLPFSLSFDYEIFEHNEAYAVASIVVRNQLSINPELLNVRGGAVAIGHHPQYL